MDPNELQGVGELRATLAKLNDGGIDVRVVAVLRTCVDRRRVLYRELEYVVPQLGLPVASPEVPLLMAQFGEGAGTWAAGGSRSARQQRRVRLPAAGRGARAPRPPTEGGGLMADRPRLQVIDDPLAVGGANAKSPDAPRSTGEELEGRSSPAGREEAVEESSGERPPKEARPNRAELGAHGDEPQKALFARAPRSLDQRLETAVFELCGDDPRATRQDLIAGLIPAARTARGPQVA